MNRDVGAGTAGSAARLDDVGEFGLIDRILVALAETGVVGGDMVASDRLVISVTALGRLDGRPAVLRSGACPGDLVVLAGRLGRAAAGLRLLRDGTVDGPLVDAHRRPDPPYGWGPRLA